MNGKNQSTEGKMSTSQRIARSQIASVFRLNEAGGWVAEVRGLQDQNTGNHEWIRLGVYGDRASAEQSVAKSLGW